jgi:DinB superfamily
MPGRRSLAGEDECIAARYRRGRQFSLFRGRPVYYWMCIALSISMVMGGYVMAESSLREALLKHFDSVFTGPNGDYAAVMEALTGVSAEKALWKPAPAQNSIWQIVEHLIGSKEWQIKMIEDGHAEPPVWIEPAGDEAAWQATLNRLKEAHSRLKLAFGKVEEADLLQVPVPEWGSTLLELILSSGPAHEAHHSGQIDYLKGLQAG